MIVLATTTRSELALRNGFWMVVIFGDRLLNSEKTSGFRLEK